MSEELVGSSVRLGEQGRERWDCQHHEVMWQAVELSPRAYTG